MTTAPDSADPAAARPAGFIVPRPVLYGIFFLSGISALIYQLVWQRSLLTIFGSQAESVAMVVSAFMVGLGLGSLFGGWLSERPGVPLLLAFSAAEAVIGAYGVASLRIFEEAGRMTGGGPLFQTAAVCFALLLIPTLFMGSTLPLLVTHHVRRTADVGRSVSWLYFVNTLGASAGCLVAAGITLRLFGMKASVLIAAGLNALAAALMFAGWLAGRRH